MAEDEHPVQENVAAHQHDGVPGEAPGIPCSHVESTEQCRHKGEEQSRNAPVHIDNGGIVNILRLQDPVEKRRGQEVRQDHGHGGQGRKEPYALPENTPDGVEARPALASFPVAPANDDLDSDGETKSQHIQDSEVYAGNGRCSQLNLAHTAQEGRVGHAQQFLHHQRDQNGERYPPNGFVGIASRKLV